MAPGAHPFRRVRPRLRDPPRDADVFPRRPAPRLRPDLPEHRRPSGARAPRLRLRARAQRTRMGARLPLRPGAARPAGDAGGPRLRRRAMPDKLIPTPSQTVGPFFHLGMDRPEWADLTADNPECERIAIE